VDTALYAEVTISIVQHGSLRASYSSSPNLSNVGILYDNSGIFVHSFIYYNQTFNTNELPDGDYTLVSMGNSQFFSHISQLSEFAIIGLQENVDYVLNELTIVSGLIREITIPYIPLFNEEDFYYTGSNTLYSINKLSTVVGNYLTLRAEIDFKEEYASAISNLKLIANIPTNCEYINNSLIATNQALGGDYTIEGNNLIIPLATNNTVVRFCIIPTQSGNYNSTAYVEFNYEGNTIRQPIGTANFTATNITINVPKTTAQTEITAWGVAKAQSQVTVFSNGIPVGQTIALANGTWSLRFELLNHYSFSYHNIHAEILTDEGFTLITEVKQVIYDAYFTELSKITMYNRDVTLFDFLHPENSSRSYVYMNNPNFRFEIEFTDNDPEKVTDLTLFVKTRAGEVKSYEPVFDDSLRVWVAITNGYLPVNVDVDYITTSTPIFDKNLMEDVKKEYDNFIDSYNLMNYEFNIILEIIEEELSKENYDLNIADSILNAFAIKYGINFFPPEDFDSNAHLTFLDGLSEEGFEAYGDELEMEIADIAVLLNTYIEYLNDFENQQGTFDYVLDNGQIISVKTCDGITEFDLINLGFEKLLTSDEKYVYLKIEENEIIYVDFEANIYVLQNTSDLRFSVNNFNVCDGVATFKSKALEWIDDIKGYYDEISKYITTEEVVYQKAYKEVKGLRGKAKNYFHKTTVNPAKKVYWLKKYLYLNKLTVGAEQTVKFLKKFGKPLAHIDIAASVYDGFKILNEFCEIYKLIPDTCPNNQTLADEYKTHVWTALGETEGFLIGKFLINRIANAVTAAVIVGSKGTALIVGGGTLLGLSVTLSYYLDSKLESFK
ncbi:MAG: hypothetical protein FWC41_14180, partial [Firmicutes bacterium]|nr:hypothetical protein [Bacillota bacterium]